MRGVQRIERPSGLAPSRRRFLVAGAAAGGGLLLGLSLPGLGGRADAAEAAAFAPDAFIRVGRDGRVGFVVPQVEMGQGIYTALSMLIAEELEVPLAAVAVEHAPANDALYANPLLGFQVTGGSTSLRAFWEPLRRAGAAARTMLVAAAAEAWGIDPAACRAEAGAVIDDSGGRRLAYGELAERAARQPVPGAVRLKDPKDFTLIGTPAKRLDTPAKVTGSAVFGIDVRRPGMKIATVAACPVFGGMLKAVDEGPALAVRGVRQVVKLSDAVAVVADHMGAAKKGLEALRIAWDEGANAGFSTADLVRDLEVAAGGTGVSGDQAGDVEAALKGAARTHEAVYRMPFLAHAAMEPINCTVELRGDRCDVWLGTQVATRARAAAAEAAGLPPERVTIHNHLLGGGFGRRLEVDSVTQAVRIARQVVGPVKVVWTREEDIRHDLYRPCYYDRLSAGLDEAGAPVAFRHRVVGSSIVARWIPALFKDGFDFDAVDGAAGPPYGFPNLLVDYVRQEPPAGLATTWWRGVGVTHNAFVVEGFLDELAHLAGADPVAYRRALLDGQPRARGVLDLAAEKAGWGVAVAAGRGRGVSLLSGFGSHMAQVAEVSLAGDGSLRIERVVCAVDCGRVVNPDTVRAQVEGGIIFGLTAALYGEITLERGRVVQGNFDSYRMLRIDETPAIEVHVVQSDEAPGGLGEPGTCGIAPAVVNAVFAATGKRLRKLPIDSSELSAS
ncbi:isoquinoline 1-oxidoreductase, beta subunit [Tistlia consotensis]|uniref:Isoquinoline 1-oxidoreductase, beta subunit n=1 Tax=Tistlia consotensis USBA 355 TaxID=560819 RepID=A0A1Y6CTK6_9PROT|nr:xanthine dehydrogenase family protein molybdopterin-binding subunit [Tistlia consotensis]SMF73375.1 isoquinoline 1-oxidoreductase, beta subunit [Tistlia consotensis USBA 355]SNS30529.1 isoquinoline 1-oxidoreductase, beta subunit [Tistlia consotensis]